MNRKRLLSIIAGAGIAALAGFGIFAASGGTPLLGVLVSRGPLEAERTEGAGARGEELAGDDDHGHGDGQEALSDLDRPVEEMWRESCEHGILTHVCDICRFQIGTVKLDPELVSRLGRPGLVGLAQAGTRRYAESRSFTGEVQLSEDKSVHVTSPLAGVLRKVHPDLGTAVKEGDVLFEIDSQEVAEAKGNYMKKSAVRDLAKRTADREAALFARKIAAEAEVLEAQAKLAEAEIEMSGAKASLTRLGVPEAEIAVLSAASPDGATGILAVRAPRSGVVLERRARPGERVETGKELFLLSDLSEVWVWADLREGDLPAVARKANGHGPIPAEVRAPGGKTYRGSMDILSGAMDERTRTVKARVVVQNADGLLRPGMFVTVRLLLPGGGKILTVPKAAVLADEGRPFVFVHTEGEYWIRRPVTLGRRTDDMVEITSGLAPGQTIIADGSFLLKSDVLRRKMGAGCAD